MPKPSASPSSSKANIGRGTGGAWTYIPIPFNVPEVFGRKGQFPSAPPSTDSPSQLAHARAGGHILGIGKDVLAGAGVPPATPSKSSLP